MSTSIHFTIVRVRAATHKQKIEEFYPNVVFRNERELFISSNMAACLAIAEIPNADHFENFRNEFASFKVVDTNSF